MFETICKWQTSYSFGCIKLKSVCQCRTHRKGFLITSTPPINYITVAAVVLKPHVNSTHLFHSVLRGNTNANTFQRDVKAQSTKHNY
uniref:Uncharacterized protein n=1 Tax=Glossina palpalis gambiensis TaxID=67801 RepID=A0A1B0B0B9_9MUSC